MLNILLEIRTPVNKSPTYLYTQRYLASQKNYCKCDETFALGNGLANEKHGRYFFQNTVSVHDQATESLCMILEPLREE